MIRTTRTIGVLCLLGCCCVAGALAQTESAVDVEATGTGGVLEFLTARRWSPYLVGFGIGVLAWISFLLSDKAIGVSTAYVRTCGMLETAARGKKTKDKPYYQKFAPKIDWEWMLVLGLFIGAFVSAITSGDFAWEMVPSRWAAAAGQNGWIRWLAALCGGILMGLGARWAGGCTSGHGISGTLQLVVSSWVAAICFFIGGIITAMIIYKIIL